MKIKLKYLVDVCRQTVFVWYFALLGIAVSFLIYFFDQAHQARHAVIAGQQLLQDLQQTEKQFAQFRDAGIVVNTSDNNMSLLALVEKSAAQAQLSAFLTQIQQTANNQVTLSFHEVSFDRLMQWLQHLSIANGVKIEKLSAIKAEKEGTVNVQVSASHVI